MFRSLLESNGAFEHNVKLQAYINDYQRAFSEYSCIEFKKSLTEQACLQYCIENGVKLEWFEGRSEYEEYKWMGEEKWYKFNVGLKTIEVCENKIYEFSVHNDSDNKFLKLIAAIYAHDIKII